jgi:hypothetical protein
MNDNENERGKFSNIMIGMAENFSAQISQQGIMLRFMALKDYSIQQIECAAIKILINRKAMGMPTIAEFVSAINGEQKSSDNAQNQVNEIMRQIREIGWYGISVFDDPITKSLLSSRWTFRYLCDMTETESKWWSKDFIEAYQSMERTERRAQVEYSGDNERKLKLLANGIGNG